VNFGRTRKRAREAAIAALRPLISTNQISGGMSTMMYFDPYVLGYLSTTASLVIKLELQGKASTLDLGLAIEEAFTQVCNVNGSEATRRIVELAGLNDSEYLRGADEASIGVLYAYQALRDEMNNSIVREAEESARAIGSSYVGGDQRSLVGGAIMMNTFHRHVSNLRAGGLHA
jgi:hypothetical protein